VSAATTTRPNYFAEGDYLSTDVRTGVMRNRAGTRMLALTGDFLLGLKAALDEECGPTADLVLKTCGRTWGAAFAARIERELSAHLGGPLGDEPLARFEAALVAMFSHHGWGKVRLDVSRHAQGVLVVAVAEPVMAAVVGTADRPADPLLAGVLAGTLSHFAGETLDCAQTQCRACGAAESLFVITHPDRLKAVADRPGRTHAAVVAELLGTRA
jgi:predicted hydrocarbon binding protein